MCDHLGVVFSLADNLWCHKFGVYICVTSQITLKGSDSHNFLDCNTKSGHRQFYVQTKNILDNSYFCFIPKTTTWILFGSTTNNIAFFYSKNNARDFVLFWHQQYGFCFPTSTTWILFCSYINNMAFVILRHQP